MLVNARDTYGQEHSGMIISILKCENAKPLVINDLYFRDENPLYGITYSDGSFLPIPPSGVRKPDRTGLGGSNANLQQDLFRTMEHLSRITGDQKYKNAAYTALRDFLRITQHPETGFLAWGEHLYWNCFEDRLGDDLEPGKIHEPKRPFIYFDYLYSVDPVRTIKYAQGLWDHQIFDKNTGDFSRHARYHIHAPGSGYDFPKEGSYFIDTWSRAYEKTKNQEFARAVSTMANRYLNRTNELGLLDWDTSGRPERANRCTVHWLLSLAIEAENAIMRMDKETAIILKRVVDNMDKGFLSLSHLTNDKGYVYYAYTSSGEPFPRSGQTDDGYSIHWGMGYGIFPTSSLGLLAYTRQEQLKTGDKADAYRKMVIRSADLYQSLSPDPKKTDIWAGEYGMAIFLQIAAYRLTNESSYLSAAQELADEAVRVFWENGRYAVPKASSLTHYHDCISYSDTLLLALLALHEHTAGILPLIEISNINR